MTMARFRHPGPLQRPVLESCGMGSPTTVHFPFAEPDSNVRCLISYYYYSTTVSRSRILIAGGARVTFS